MENVPFSSSRSEICLAQITSMEMQKVLMHTLDNLDRRATVLSDVWATALVLRN